MRRGLFVAAVFAAASSWAQGAPAPSPVPLPEPSSESGTLESIPAALIGEALTVSIIASVGRPSEAPSWEAKDLKYTIPGTSVSVRMMGRDVAIVITVTPYRNKDGGLLLVAQGQVWYKDADATLRYRTTVDTLSVDYGERVLFYPFGAQPDVGAPLRVELVMGKYDSAPDAQAAGAAPAPASAPSPAKDKAKP